MIIVNSDSMRKIEEKANAEGLSFYDMMVNAGTSCAEIICEYVNKNQNITVIAGKGKNGGDGFVIAGRLKKYGYENISIILAMSEPSVELCKTVKDEFINDIPVYDYTSQPENSIEILRNSDCSVDAVFGIGFKGELDDCIHRLAVEHNKVKMKIAVDIPSGLDALGKSENSVFFNSDLTVTMYALKPVHIFQKHLCGEVRIASIGVDLSYSHGLCEKYFTLDGNEAKSLLSKRKFDANKGNFGKIICIAGSYEMCGAAYFCNQGAVEVGAGLVCACFPDKAYSSVASKLNEPLMFPVESNSMGRFSKNAVDKIADKIKWADVVLIGCGMGIDEDTEKVFRFVLENCEKTLIIDADGINLLSKNINVLKKAKCEIVLTPHPGEMARLTGLSIDEIQSNRIGIAVDFAVKYGVTLVLKGANTVVANKNGKAFVNTTGNAGMARGGMGDVLAGAVAGIIPQCKSVFEGACAGVYFHSEAGDNVLKQYGSFCKVTPTRVLNSLSL